MCKSPPITNHLHPPNSLPEADHIPNQGKLYCTVNDRARASQGYSSKLLGMESTRIIPRSLRSVCEAHIQEKTQHLTRFSLGSQTTKHVKSGRNDYPVAFWVGGGLESGAAIDIPGSQQDTRVDSSLMHNLLRRGLMEYGGASAAEPPERASNAHHCIAPLPVLS